MSLDLSTPQGKYKLANNTNFHMVWQLCIGIVADEIFNQVNDPDYYIGMQAAEKMKKEAESMYRNGPPKVGYGQAIMFLANINNTNVDDTKLAESPLFTALKNETKKWFAKYCRVTESDKTTPIN